jgi:hypothetical protein
MVEEDAIFCIVKDGTLLPFLSSNEHGTEQGQRQLLESILAELHHFYTSIDSGSQ